MNKYRSTSNNLYKLPDLQYSHSEILNLQNNKIYREYQQNSRSENEPDEQQLYLPADYNIEYNENDYTVNNIDDFTIENNQRKTENYTIDNQNSFKVSSLDHGWQYFNTYGPHDDRTLLKLEDEIIKYWEKIPENSHQEAWNAILNSDTTEMNNIINNTFAQVTPYYPSNSIFNQF